MLYKAIAVLSLLLPAVGLYIIEIGNSANTANINGYAIGATMAYVCFATIIVAVVAVILYVGVFDRLGAGRSLEVASAEQARSIEKRALICLLPMAIFTFVISGGYQAATGMVSAGEFRAGGAGGALGYLVLKYYAPTITAFALVSRVQAGIGLVSPRSVAIVVLLALVALSFGYKAGIVTALLPLAIIALWRARYRTAIPVFGLGAVLVIIGYFTVQGGRFVGTLLDALVRRIFLLHGDVSWRVWQMHIEGAEFPNYWNTLGTVLGDRVFSFVAGVTRADPEAWVNAHFSLMATHAVGYPADAIVSQGHNAAATIFSEGIIAGGVAGLLVVAILAGTVLVALYKFIDNRLRANDIAAAAIASSYFVVGVVAWILGGGVTELVHISIIVGVSSTWLLLWWIRGGNIRAVATALEPNSSTKKSPPA